MKLHLGFDNIAIKQKKNICSSRNDVDINSEIIRGVTRPIPLIASNMLDVVNSSFIIQLEKLGALGIMHRAFTQEEDYLSEIVKITYSCEYVAASIGINNHDYILANNLIKAGVNIINIDVSHCYCDKALTLCQDIRRIYPHVKIIVGNTVNQDAIEFFNDYVDAIKIGVASGSVCETKNTSGCYKPQFSAVEDLKTKAQKYGMPIISDGGTKEPADFPKAIGAGASAVMAGSIFAKCPESAASIVEVDGVKKKVYSGMASRAIQEKWRKRVHNDCPEGRTTFIDIGEPVDKLLARYSGALRSGITQAGAKDIKSFHKNVEFIRVS